jgi:hypothetical protein
MILMLYLLLNTRDRLITRLVHSHTNNTCKFNFFTHFIKTYLNSRAAIGCHASACLLLSYIILDGWQCGWFWWIFSFGSILPILNDSCILVDILVNRKY